MGPLTGVKVVEIASLAPAPFGCMILADLGAEVLRVGRLRRRRDEMVRDLALEPIGRAGQRPHAPQNLLADFAGGGLMLALGIVSALFERGKSGRGQVVDAAMIDGAALLTTFLHGMHANGMWDGARGTNVLDGAASFYDTYETSDSKYMAVGCVEPQFYAEFLNTLGLDDPGLPFQLDASAWPDMKKLIGETFAQKTRAEWTEIFADSDACVTPVLSPWEAHEHPHNRARDVFVQVDGALQPAPAPRFSRTENARPVPTDDGGRDVARTLAAWGFGNDEIARLQSSGAVS